MHLLLLLLVTMTTMTSTSRVLELSDRFLDIRKDGIWLIKVNNLIPYPTS